MPGRGTAPGPELYPECGTREGMLRHRREKTRNCGACRAYNRQAMARYRVRHIIEGPRLVSTLGLKRRVRALARRGWRQADLAERLGMTWQAFAKIVQQTETHRELADRVAVLYRELWDQDGPSVIARQMAERAGWPSPAEWDDPDDPAENPVAQIVIEKAHAAALAMDRARRKNQNRQRDRRQRRPVLRLLEGGRQSGGTSQRQKAAMAT